MLILMVVLLVAETETHFEFYLLYKMNSRESDKISPWKI